jgi:(2Fe-2S) ferredoxin
MTETLHKLRRRARARGMLHSAEDNGSAAATVQHVFLCTGKKCDRKLARRSLRRLKRQAAALRRDGIPLVVTEVACFKLCVHGPLAVVHPAGTWYHDVSPEVVDAICATQLRGGPPVATHALTATRERL